MSEIFIKSSRLRELLKWIGSNYIAVPILHDIANHINERQIENKEWLVDHVKEYIQMFPKEPKILILAGWYGLAGRMITDNIPCDVTVIDKNPECALVGRRLYPNLVHKTAGLNDFEISGYNIIICTACEHITDNEINNVLRKKDKSTVVFLQSNNYNEIEDHINCKKSVDDFANSLKLSSYKKYILSLDKYERFMVIGK